MGKYFFSLSDQNNVRMLGNNAIGLKDYQTAYLRRGGSTNISVSPTLLASFAAAPNLPENMGGLHAPSGDPYLSGYSTISIKTASNDLVFSGIPVLPQDRPHLVSTADFLLNTGDNFVTGQGSPGYPADTVPPNTFRGAGDSQVDKKSLFTGAVSCAIVGCLTNQYMMQIPYGYIELKNGPTEPGPKAGLAATGNDIFSHALGGMGIDVTSGSHEWFCRGSDGEIGDTKNVDKSMNLFQGVMGQAYKLVKANQLLLADLSSAATPEARAAIKQDIADDQEAIKELQTLQRSGDLSGNLICRWAAVNNLQSDIAKGLLYAANIPDVGVGVRYIRHHLAYGVDVVPSVGDLKNIKECAGTNCHWKKDYAKSPTDNPCMQMLYDFRVGYGEFGTAGINLTGNGYTALEQWKCDVMSARVMCQNAVNAPPPAAVSGSKWFDHSKAYAAPKEPYNFGIPKTPYEYLQMIDQVKGANGCALGATMNTLLKRCQQIKPSASLAELTSAIGPASSPPLPLNGVLYLYADTTNKLVCSVNKPLGFVLGTTPDGTTPPVGAGCGEAYDVIYKYVDTATTPGKSAADPPTFKDYDGGTDGGFPGCAFGEADKGTCTDQAIWTPSSGYNNLLGQLYFTNSCKGAGGFAQPN